MNYKDTLSWMFSKLPMYQRQGKSAYKKDLSNILLLTKLLKKPETKFKSIHVAGTNGKGSTSHMLASILQEAGYKVGLYTSPHLKDFRERIKVNGKEVSKDFVINFIKSHRRFFEVNELSFFEMTVGMAFDYFSKQNVDIAIIEVGLGGRLDSTNIISPILSIITNIGFDHTQFLGNTLEKIASEKAGIIKTNTPVIIGETKNETAQVFINVAKEHNSELYFADKIIDEYYNSDLKGNYQEENKRTVVQSINILRELGFKILDNHLKEGFLNVVENTGLQGRWQILQKEPEIICDTAHNVEGLSIVIKQLLQIPFKRMHIVFGVVNDKNLDSIIPVMPPEATYYFCRPNIERGLDACVLQKIFIESGLKGNVYDSAEEALQASKQAANTKDLIFVGGSTFVVAEII